MSENIACAGCGEESTLRLVTPEWIYRRIEGTYFDGSSQKRTWNGGAYGADDVESMDDRRQYVLCVECGKTYEANDDEQEQAVMDLLVRTYKLGGNIVQTNIIRETGDEDDPPGTVLWALECEMTNGTHTQPMGGSRFRTANDAAAAMDRIEMTESGPVVRPEAS